VGCKGRAHGGAVSQGKGTKVGGHGRLEKPAGEGEEMPLGGAGTQKKEEARWFY
jgi:hypothetical protein